MLKFCSTVTVLALFLPGLGTLNLLLSLHPLQYFFHLPPPTHIFIATDRKEIQPDSQNRLAAFKSQDEEDILDTGVIMSASEVASVGKGQGLSCAKHS